MENKKEKSDKENQVAALVEGKRQHTSLNLKIVHLDALAEIAKDRGFNKTSMMDDVLETAIRQYNNTEKIDNMLKMTGGYWVERNLATVTACIPPKDAANLSAYQKAYLYINLKDNTDKQRTFKVLGLQDDLDEIDAMNKMLDASHRIEDNEVVGFNIAELASEIAGAIKINLSNIQVKYLQLTVGAEATEKIRERVPDKFPKNTTFKPDDKKTATDDAAIELDLEAEVTG